MKKYGNSKTISEQLKFQARINKNDCFATQ